MLDNRENKNQTMVLRWSRIITIVIIIIIVIVTITHSILIMIENNMFHMCHRTQRATNNTQKPLANISRKAATAVEEWVRLVGWLVGCLTSQQQASVSQGRICSDNFTCCHTEIEVADPTFYLTQSQYTDTGPISPSADPITPGAWQGSHWSANF